MAKLWDALRFAYGEQNNGQEEKQIKTAIKRKCLDKLKRQGKIGALKPRSFWQGALLEEDYEGQ